MTQSNRGIHAALITSTAIIALTAASPASAQARAFNIPAQAAATAIPELARQADVQILVASGAVRGKRTPSIKGNMPVAEALQRLLQGTGLHVLSSDGRTFTLGIGQVERPAAAVENKADDNEVVVTGTRIRRPNMVSAAPITSITAREIQAQAAVNIEEVLNRMPQIAPDSQQNYQDSDGRQRIKLRNLGFERTLTLIDGQRAGTQNGVDVGMIPTSMVERIDILSGGASSVYGSDAISGVVNFILKKDFTGLQIDGNYSFYNHTNRANIITPIAQTYAFATPLGQVNDGARADLTLTAGKHLFDDALKVSGFVNYRKANFVPYTNRATSACQLNEAGKDGVLSCQRSTYSSSGYISPQSGPNAGSVYVNNPNGTRTFVGYGNGPGLAANPYDGYPYQRAAERVNAGGFASLKISDAAELYSTGLWFHDKSSNPYPTRIYSYTVYGGTPYQVNCNNPFLSASQASTICGAQAGTSATVPLEVRYRFNNLPPATDVYVNEGVRITAGVRGDIGEAWHYDLGGVYARNRQAYTASAYADFDKVNRSLNVVNVNGVPTCAAKISGVDPNCVPFDAFSANNSDAALGNYLFTGRDGTTIGRNALYDVLFNVTGDLGKYGIKSPWAEQGIALAIGAEYREDHLNNTADALYRSQNGGSDVTLQQNVKEANIELQVPIFEKRRFAELLQVNGGYRVSKYDTNPETFSTWKAEGLYSPLPGLTFRGSINKAQRAPTVVEIAQATGSSYGLQGGSQNDFCAGTITQEIDPTDPTGTRRIPTYHAPTVSREICAATGLTGSLAALYGSTTLSCPNSQCTVRTGGFTVDPETAYTKTFGVLIQPRFLPRFAFSVDRYIIDLNNSIGYNDYSYYQDGCAKSGLAYFCSFLVRDAATGILYNAAGSNPTSGYIRQGTTNNYKLKSHGWDFQGQYTLLTQRLGSVEWIFNGSLATVASQQDSPIQPVRDCADGYYGSGCGQLIPKWSHGLRTTYTTPDQFASISLNWRHIGPLLNTTNSGLFGFTAADVRQTFYRIPAYDYFDLAISFRIARQFGFRITANNLLDKDPPIIPNSYSVSLSRNNTIPQRYDSLGRNISFGTTIKF
ncbi:TonB-dependent receptor [Sphingomonas sp. GB1N7]|uniref:TonB-dependent receptor n=1 Tax=Parasphingomonas caseinilytica TaxID=3096158 RepID=UPI002FCA4912